MVGDPKTTANVRELMDEARRAQSESGVSMRGRPQLKDAQRFAIRATATSCAIVAAPLHAEPKTKIGLLERFEEMCRRRHIEVPADMRPAILEAMLTELSINRQALTGSESKLVPVTAYCGAIGPKLSTEFPEFRDTPGIFRRAAVHNPSDPRGFLRGMQQSIAALAADDKFAEFRDTPGIFRQAAMQNPSDPRGFLRGMQQSIAALAADDEFAEFRDTPSIFRQVAFSNPRDPRSFLRGAQRRIAELAADDEFAAFRDAPGIFRQAAVYNPSDPRGFLRKAQATMRQLVADDEFAEFRDTPGIFRLAAVRSPSDSRGFLRRVQTTIRQLVTDEEFSAFRDTPGIFRLAAVGNPSDPRKWLRSEPKSNWHVLRVKRRWAVVTPKSREPDI